MSIHIIPAMAPIPGSLPLSGTLVGYSKTIIATFRCRTREERISQFPARTDQHARGVKEDEEDGGMTAEMGRDGERRGEAGRGRDTKGLIMLRCGGFWKIRDIFYL